MLSGVEQTKVTERGLDFLASIKELRDVAESIPDEICSLPVRRKPSLKSLLL
jgi:hypothetical protein